MGRYPRRRWEGVVSRLRMRGVPAESHRPGPNRVEGQRPSWIARRTPRRAGQARHARGVPEARHAQLRGDRPRQWRCGRRPRRRAVRLRLSALSHPRGEHRGRRRQRDGDAHGPHIPRRGRRRPRRALQARRRRLARERGGHQAARQDRSGRRTGEGAGEPRLFIRLERRVLGVDRVADHAAVLGERAVAAAERDVRGERGAVRGVQGTRRRVPGERAPDAAAERTDGSLVRSNWLVNKMQS
mmetsp:Transcript_5272/g.21515  ORF Transcript_5272/g.21515 Transcript_5272/m.21515 type:complete len:242 (-) Transcript_5272:10-735(-)